MTTVPQGLVIHFRETFDTHGDAFNFLSWDYGLDFINRGDGAGTIFSDGVNTFRIKRRDDGRVHIVTTTDAVEGASS